MFSLAINFGAGGVAWSLLFTKKESLDASIAALSLAGPDDDVGFSDDFGTTAVIKRSQINGWLVENLELSKGAMVYRNVHHSRMQAEFQNQVMNDPALARMRGEGSPIIQPFPRQGRAS